MSYENAVLTLKNPDSFFPRSLESLVVTARAHLRDAHFENLPPNLLTLQIYGDGSELTPNLVDKLPDEIIDMFVGNISDPLLQAIAKYYQREKWHGI